MKTEGPFMRLASAIVDFNEVLNELEQKAENFGGARMWEVIHGTNDLKLPVINVPPSIPPINEDDVKYKNPFRVGSDVNPASILELELNTKRLEKERYKELSVAEKTTYSRKVKQLPKLDRKEVKLPPVNVPQARNIDENGLKSKRQPLSEHIQNLRQRRLILYSAHIMQEEMKNLDESIKAEENKLNLAEEDMRKSLNKLDNARMEMDQRHIEARQMSRQLVMECNAQRVKINTITSQKMSLELDISDAKEKLMDYKMYHDILKKLSMQAEEEADKQTEVEEPGSVKFGEQGKQEKSTLFEVVAQRRASKHMKSFLMPRKSIKPGKFRRSSTKVIKISRSQSQSDDIDMDQGDFDTDRDLEPLTTVNVYFESAEQVMELCTELYYQNITRILKFRQIEDELKETQIALAEANKRKEANLAKLTQHIKERTEELNKKKAKLKDIQEKVMIHSAGANLAANKESHWENLKKKVNDVYVSLLGKSKVRISTQQKLTNIENRLFELLHLLEKSPPEKVEAIWENKSKEKKQNLKELCIKDLRERRNKLIKKSWKNVNMAAKRGPTRKLMCRSMPTIKKKDENKVVEKILSYDDDMAYYFSV